MERRGTCPTTKQRCPRVRMVCGMDVIVVFLTALLPTQVDLHLQSTLCHCEAWIVNSPRY